MSVILTSIIQTNAVLGEGPIWDVTSAKLWWVDIYGNKVYRFDPTSENKQEWTVPANPGTVVPRGDGGAILALRSGLATLDAQGHLTLLNVTHEHGADFSFNDGKCDARGRLWVGTQDDTPNTFLAHLYCWDGVTLQRKLDRIGLSNGIGWSRDGATMYYIDSLTQRLDTCDFDLEHGALSNRRPAVHFPKEMGIPDGLAVDSEGMIWVGMWGGSRVQRCDPATGRLLEHISLPVSQVTACAFGGPDLKDLYITSAAFEIDLKKEPRAGHVFHCRPGVAGLATNRSA